MHFLLWMVSLANNSQSAVLAHLVLCQCFILCCSIATLLLLSGSHTALWDLPQAFYNLPHQSWLLLATASNHLIHSFTAAAWCSTLIPAFTFFTLTFFWRWFFLKFPKREGYSGCQAATAAAVLRISWWSSSKQNREAAQRLFQSCYWLCHGTAVSSLLPSFLPYVYRQIRMMDWDADRSD